MRLRMHCLRHDCKAKPCNMELLLQLCDAAEGGSLAEAGGEATKCGEATFVIECAAAGGAAAAGSAAAEGGADVELPKAASKRGRPAKKKKKPRQNTKAGDKNSARAAASVLGGHLGNLQLAAIVVSPPTCAPSPPSPSYLLALEDDIENNQPAAKRVCSKVELAMQAAVGRKGRRLAIAHVYVHGSELFQLDCCEPECFWACERALEGAGNRGGWVCAGFAFVLFHCGDFGCADFLSLSHRVSFG